jgi:hypothetical protein
VPREARGSLNRPTPLVAAASARRRRWLVSGAPVVTAGTTSRISERCRRHRSGEHAQREQKRSHTLHPGHRILLPSD